MSLTESHICIFICICHGLGHLWYRTEGSVWDATSQCISVLIILYMREMSLNIVVNTVFHHTSNFRPLSFCTHCADRAAPVTFGHSSIFWRRCFVAGSHLCNVTENHTTLMYISHSYLVTIFITNLGPFPESAGQHGAALHPSEKRALSHKSFMPQRRQTFGIYVYRQLGLIKPDPSTILIKQW